MGARASCVTSTILIAWSHRRRRVYRRLHFIALSKRCKRLEPASTPLKVRACSGIANCKLHIHSEGGHVLSLACQGFQTRHLRAASVAAKRASETHVGAAGTQVKDLFVNAVLTLERATRASNLFQVKGKRKRNETCVASCLLAVARQSRMSIVHYFLGTLHVFTEEQNKSFTSSSVLACFLVKPLNIRFKSKFVMLDDLEPTFSSTLNRRQTTCK